MADGGQRLLDVIDDPNALESFLGGLTADSELLPSAESVDNVVASLARSLEGDYEVDSPNDTLFDTLEPSSNNLTDISQSYVNSDFDNVNMSNQGNYSGMESMSNGELSHVQHHQNLQNSMSSVVTSGAEQYLVSSHQNTSTSSSSHTSTSIQQFSSNNSICDSSSLVSTTSSIATANSQFFQQQQQQIQIGQNQVILQNTNNNNTSYMFNNSNQQTQQIVGISSGDGQQISNTSLNNMISVAVSNSNTDGGQGMTNTFIQQQVNGISQQGQQMQIIGQPTSSTQQNSNNINIVNVTSSNSNSVSSTTISSELNSNNNSNVTGNNTPNSNTMQQQQYVASATPQATTINQLVSGQTVNLSNMNVGGAQLISNGNIVTTGQGQANIIQQIQSANGGQSYITMEQPTTALLAGPGGFGGANLALVTTGGQPTYTVVPSGTQFLSNAIMAQPQSIQTLTKGPNGTYYQTTSGTQIVTSNVNPMHNITVSVANTNSNKPKQPPQLLPKPQANGSSSNASSQGNHSSGVDAVSSNSVTSTNTTQTSGTVCTPSEGVMTQIYQQQQATQIQGLQNQVVVTSVGNNVGGMTIPQQQFTLGNAAGIGQVMVSQNHNQQQLTGTIVLNQYGQPMLLPTASTGQGGGLQFILRQQPTQPQMLTIQAPAGTTTIGNQSVQGTAGKPMVRYVSQMPQVAQTSGYGLQQIQTANGPAWVAVRYPQPNTTTISTSAGQFSQIQTETLIHNQSQISNQPQQVQVQTLQQQQIQSVPPSPQPQISQPQTPQPQNPQPQTPQQTPQPQTPQPKPSTPKQTKKQAAQVATPDSSSGPPPAKKPKTKKSNKKKVTLDLEQLLKQSGIMDEDLEDDGSFNFNFGTPESVNGFSSSPVQQSPVQQQNVIPPSPVQVQSSPVQHPAVNTSGNKNTPATPKKAPPRNRKKKTPEKPKSPSPPPPPIPAPKSKGGGGGSRKKGGNQKADIKTEASKTPALKKLSSIDSVSATIAAVAANRTPSPPSSPAPVLPPAPKPRPVVAPIVKPMTTPPVHVPIVPSSISNNIGLLGGGGGMVPNGMNSQLPSQPPGTRIVHTIQLTPQNQLLLRNIQTQIARLVSLPKRNDNEQSALQKLIVLQQQVIATGIPVPNPSHLNNLTQNVNTNASPTPTVLQASTVSTAPSSGITAVVGGDSLKSSNSSSSNSSASNVSNVSSLPQSINTSNIPSTNQSNNNNIQKLIQSPKLSTLTNSASAIKPINVSGSVTPVDIPTTTNNDSTNNSVGITSTVQPPSNVVKVVNSNANINPDANANVGSTEDNDKENSTGGPALVVASSNFTTSTNTTNSLGQHHLQSFPATFRSSIDDKKADEQRLANQKADEEKRARWKKEEFEMLLKRDQQCVVKPDYEIPFSSKRDAVERLMKYHILRDRNDMHFDEFDAEFAEKSSLLLDKFQGMISKHRSLLMKESMREVGCAERVMLERMFGSEEKLKLEQDRQLVSQGDYLELPPPPTAWVPKIKEMVDKEIKELERDSYQNLQVQSAIDSIIGFGNTDAANFLPDEGDKVEYDAFGVPITINNGAYGGMNSSSSADIDEAVRSILS